MSTPIYSKKSRRSGEELMNSISFSIRKKSDGNFYLLQFFMSLDFILFNLDIENFERSRFTQDLNNPCKWKITFNEEGIKPTLYVSGSCSITFSSPFKHQPIIIKGKQIVEKTNITFNKTTKTMEIDVSNNLCKQDLLRNNKLKVKQLGVKVAPIEQIKFSVSKGNMTKKFGQRYRILFSLDPAIIDEKLNLDEIKRVTFYCDGDNFLKWYLHFEEKGVLDFHKKSTNSNLMISAIFPLSCDKTVELSYISKENLKFNKNFNLIEMDMSSLLNKRKDIHEF